MTEISVQYNPLNKNLMPACVRKSFLLMVIMCLSASVMAQNLAQHNWYFGNSVNGIRFNRATNKAQAVSNKAIPFGTGGSAVATDPATADLWFYTDGANVYDAYHQKMPNGSVPNGNTVANQPAVICAVPGQTNKYYVFTNSANFATGGTINRSVVDMSLFGNAVFPSPASGDVETASKNTAVTGLTGRSEGMIVVPHSDSLKFWLITHQNGSTSYSATLIDPATYTSGTFTSVVSNNIGVNMSVANFAYNAKKKKLAVSPQTANTNAMLLNFDNTTGAITLDQVIFNSGTNQSIYDIEWDNKGQYLYISQNSQTGTSGDVLQFDYTNTSITLASILKTPEARSYGLQMAPDSTIYHLYQATNGGPFLVETFSRTDTVASAVVTSAPFKTTDFQGTQFPSFLAKNKIKLKVSFTYIGQCQNNPTSFFPDVSPNADSLNWDFGDSHDTTAWSPVHKYTTAQTFSVKLTAYYQGQRKDTTESVTINPFALQLQLVQDTTACKCQLPGRRAPGQTCDLPDFSVTAKVTGGTATSYTWSNGDTGATLKPDSAGYYYVVVTDGSGCSTYAGVNVKEYGLQDQRRNIWYFGTHAGIDFNKTPPKALSKSAMDAPDGCSIACDRNGQVIFYTDGDKVYDRTDTQIDSGIGGAVPDNTSTQSALIVAVPGDETLYYIFTTQSINGTNPYELRYSLFDLKQNNGKGAVTKKNVLLFSKSTERITANGKWLIAHEYGNNTFRVYPIKADGIGDPIYSAIGSDHSLQTAENGEGYMRLGPKNELAVALSTPTVSNLVELFQLSDTTGMLRNYRKIDLKQPTGQVYGVEFSPGGNKVFATVKGSPSGGPSTLYEYFLDSLTKPHLKKVFTPVNGIDMGAIVLAPDNQIYMAIKDATSMGTIQANDDTTRVSTFNQSGFALASGTSSKLGLPNFIQQQQNGFGGPGFSFTGLCLGDSTHFTGQATDAIDKFQWFFGDGGSSTDASPAHIYAAAGKYVVTMHLTNRCHLDTTIVQNVVINPPPAKPTIPATAALCNGPITLNANTANTTGLTYAWTTGDTTQTVTVTVPKTISVTNTDTNGCSSKAQSIVSDNRPQVNLGPDVTICQNTTVTPLDAKNPGDTYAWLYGPTASPTNTSTSQTESVDTTVPGSFIYKVTVTDPVTTCTAKDDITYTINVSPVIALSKIADAGNCGQANGIIKLDFNVSTPAGGPYSYSFSGPTPITPGTNQASATSVSPGSLLAGTYMAVVIDQNNGCSASSSVGVSNNAFSATAAVQNNCNPSTVAVTIVGGPPTAPVNYTFTNSSTGVVVSGTSSTVQLPSGFDYTIQLKDAAGCIYALNENVPASTLPTITITPQVCTAPFTLSATSSGAPISGDWSVVPAGGISGTATGVPSVQITATGNYTVSVVTPSGPSAGCPASQSLAVTINTSITADFTQSSACATDVLLTATPNGNYTYRWYKDGVFQSSLLGRVIDVTAADNGSSFQVEVVDASTGCTVKSTSKPVQVIGTVTATLSSTQACLNDKPFTLTATTNATGATYAWALNGTAIANATTATLDQTSEGTYQVTVTLGTCSATSKIQVVKAPVPVGILPSGAIICNDPDNKDPNTQKVDLDPGAFIKYDWYKNTISLSYTKEVYTADSEGVYEVDITNSYGCTSTDQTNVINDCEPKIVAPNAFRPTSILGTNQSFFVYSFFITDNFEVLIFNRWGELIYESKDRHFKWNGGFNNNSSQPAPGGTYAYVIHYQSSFHPEKGVQEERGGVVLLR